MKSPATILSLLFPIEWYARYQLKRYRGSDSLSPGRLDQQKIFNENQSQMKKERGAN